MKKRPGGGGVRLATLAKRDKNRCHICGLGVAVADRSRDHIVPVSMGGSSAASNLALAHRKCNTLRRSEPSNTRVTPRGWRKPPRHPSKKVARA